MAHPTDRAIALIKDYVNANISGGFANGDVYLSDRLNDPHYSGNPVATTYVPTNFNSTNVMASLSPSSVRNVLDLSCTPTDVLPLLNTSPHDEVNIYWCNVWANAYISAGCITLSEYASITGIINAVELDPSYNSGISWSSVYLNRPVDLNDIEYCR